MKTYETAHRAAMAHAGAHKARVQNCLTYTDRLIRRREIRPVVNGNKQVKHWIIVGPKDWWLVLTAVHQKPRIVNGPFATKRAALDAGKSKTSKKVATGCYEVRKAEGSSLLAVTTEFAEGMGLNP